MATTIGKYRLVRELARGGMGVVWAAEDPTLERPVAVKLINSPISGSDAERPGELFLREAQTVARLRHANVVEIHDFGVTEAGDPYMVMELLEGETLSTCLARARRLSPLALQPLVVQLGKALGAAHELGIVHRDLKPANIFLIRRELETVVKILDFGLALMQTQSPRDHSVGIAGTPYYMSPEQIVGGVIDHRADLWGLAVIIYRALTGRMPFEASALSGLIGAIRGQPFVPPSAIVDGLSPELDGFFARALAKDPTRRFDSVQALVQAFCAAIPARASQPVKILVVDDEPDISLLIEQCFDDQIESGRYQLAFANDGQDAVDQLCEHVDVDVVVTDLRMPGMDGFELLDKLAGVAPAARAIVMSAYGDMANIRRAMNSGAFDFLTKPVDYESLEATINKAAEDVRRRREALQSVRENATLRMFVSPTILERLLPLIEHPGGMAGTLQEACVVVVRAFTDSESSARATVEGLNQTWDALVRLLGEHGGTVVSFLGDALIAVFEGVDHEPRALGACVAIRDEAPAASLQRSVGVCSGRVISGNVGAPSHHRFDYAVFGEPAILAHELAWTASPGEVYTTLATARIDGTRCACEPTGATIVVSGHERAVYRLPPREPARDNGGDAETLPFTGATLVDAKPG